jgi:hypothetical protein
MILLTWALIISAYLDRRAISVVVEQGGIAADNPAPRAKPHTSAKYARTGALDALLSILNHTHAISVITAVATASDPMLWLLERSYAVIRRALWLEVA